MKNKKVVHEDSVFFGYGGLLVVPSKNLLHLKFLLPGKTLPPALPSRLEFGRSFCYGQSEKFKFSRKNNGKGWIDANPRTFPLLRLRDIFTGEATTDVDQAYIAVQNAFLQSSTSETDASLLNALSRLPDPQRAEVIACLKEQEFGHALSQLAPRTSQTWRTNAYHRELVRMKCGI